MTEVGLIGNVGLIMNPGQHNGATTEITNLTMQNRNMKILKKLDRLSQQQSKSNLVKD